MTTQLRSDFFDKFVDPLRLPLIVDPVSSTPSLDEYEIEMKQTTIKFHSALPPTPVFRYGETERPIILETRSGKPVKVSWRNDLPNTHILTDYLDPNLHEVSGNPECRTVVHVHGGEQAAADDGHPMDWHPPGTTRINNYPNQPQSRMLMWHDHAMGNTRLNVYSGLGSTGSGWLIRDSREDALGLPSGEYEIPLFLTDRRFNDDGTLVYSSTAGVTKWKPDFFGNVQCVNNVAWPKHEVKRGQYRLRFVNNSDSRIYNLQLVRASDLATQGPAFVQIGSDGGFLSETRVTETFVLAPAERFDCVVDFSSASPGEEFVLVNNDSYRIHEHDGARHHLGGGEGECNCYWPADDKEQYDRRIDAGNMRCIMKFKVRAPMGHHGPVDVPGDFIFLNCVPSTPRRQVILSHNMDGTTGVRFAIDNRSSMMSSGITPVLGSTEVWEFINMQQGNHPMHIHLVNFQLHSRQKFNYAAYKAAFDAANPSGTGVTNPVDVSSYLQGSPVLGDEGWKDVIQCYPRQVTRVVIRFAPQDGSSFAFDPTVLVPGVSQAGYVMHCHLLSHEDWDMMTFWQPMS